MGDELSAGLTIGKQLEQHEQRLRTLEQVVANHEKDLQTIIQATQQPRGPSEEPSNR